MLVGPKSLVTTFIWIVHNLILFSYLYWTESRRGKLAETITEHVVYGGYLSNFNILFLTYSYIFIYIYIPIYKYKAPISNCPSRTEDERNRLKIFNLAIYSFLFINLSFVSFSLWDLYEIRKLTFKLTTTSVSRGTGKFTSILWALGNLPRSCGHWAIYLSPVGYILITRDWAKKSVDRVYHSVLLIFSS